MIFKTIIMAKKSVFILGAGLIGRPMALDLVRNNEFEVGIADISPKALERFKGTSIRTYESDL